MAEYLANLLKQQPARAQARFQGRMVQIYGTARPTGRIVVASAASRKASTASYVIQTGRSPLLQLQSAMSPL